MNAAGWDVQDNGQALCPRHGPLLSVNSDGTRGYLHLDSGIRVVLDVQHPGVVSPPPGRDIGGVRVDAPEAALLRSGVALRHAAALITELGEQRGALVSAGGYGGTLVIRTGGVSVALTPATARAERRVLFLQDPRPPRDVRGPRGPSLLPALLGMTAAWL